MNRRGFIATLTALAGAALAKIKAPRTRQTRTAAPKIPVVSNYLAVHGPGILQPKPLTGMVKMSGKHYLFTKDSIYVLDNNGLNKITNDERVA